jgi:Tfp pilus assembly PilM family ATPase
MARTIGAKDKTPRKKNPAVSLEAQMKKWDEEQAKVDFQELCQKLQNALAKSYVDCDLLEATVSEQRTIIKYLESKVREAATV